MIDTATIVLLIAGACWWAWQQYKGKEPNEQIRDAAEKGAGILTWLNFKMINGLTLNPLLFAIWFGGNIWFGNLAALEAMINWLNTLNEGHVSFPYTALVIFSMFPSLMQWWLESQFDFDEEEEYQWIHWATWGLIGLDVMLCTAGYWAYWGMPSEASKLSSEHGAALVLFVVIAFFCNVYAETALHRSLEELISVLNGKSEEKSATKKRKESKGGEEKKKKPSKVKITKKQLDTFLNELNAEVEG